jgi:hypothetical protein
VKGKSAMFARHGAEGLRSLDASLLQVGGCTQPSPTRGSMLQRTALSQ